MSEVSLAPSGGRLLLPSLREESGYEVVRLVRGEATGEGQVSWDPAQPLRPQSVSGFEAVIHLAGESIVGRWTTAQKRRILDSRVQGTRHLVDALSEAAERPGVLITASAIPDTTAIVGTNFCAKNLAGRDVDFSQRFAASGKRRTDGRKPPAFVARKFARG